MKLLPCAAAAALCFASGTQAQSWPSKPVRMVVPLAPGGGVDIIARTFAQKYSEAFKQPFVVDNRPGAGGTLGADSVAKAPKDGYTWLVSSASHAVSANLYKNLPYDAIRDFAPASQIIATYLMLVANTQVPAGSVKELVALARSQPGKLNFGSTGAGGSPHLITELFNLEAGVNAVHIPYKGDAPLQPALIGNQVQYALLTPTAVLGHIKAGKLRGLAVTGRARAAVAPDVPTMAEAGLPGVEYIGWISIFATGGTPRDILGRVSEETARALKMPDVAQRVPGWGGEPAGTSPEEFAKLYRSDLQKYGRIIKAAGVKLQD